MAHDGITCPKCFKVEMKPRPAASGADTIAYQCPACGKMAVLDIAPNQASKPPEPRPEAG